MEHTLAAGDGISHYRIVGALGTGGMGEVYLAQDLTLERSVALKVLPPQLVRNEERLRRFVIEAKAASSLNHPSIVTIYEIGSGAVERDGEAKDAIHYIAMERIDGHTLAESIHAENVDLRRLLGYLAQAADGIAKAHGAGIVHRDLKPGNIMVTRDGFAKVLDFGLAKLMESRPADEQASVAPTRTGAHTGAGTVMGTVGYMSPEQVQGKSVDHRSDIFSFGCILYEAVTRRRAFEADSAIDTMHKILHDAPVESHELNPKAPADLRRLVRRCLAKSPDQRLQSMKDLAIELREIADNYESLSSSTTSGSGVSATLATPRPARSRAWLLGGTFVAILAVAGLAIGLSGIFRQRQAPPAEAAPAAGLKITSISGRPGVSGVAISGDGKYLAYSDFSSGSSSIWVRQLATGSEVQVVPPRRSPIGGLRFSPSGDYLFYLVAGEAGGLDTTLERVPTLGGPSRKIVSDVGFGISLTPDGKSVGFLRPKLKSGEMSAIVRDLEQGQERTLGTVAEPLTLMCPPALSPDGKTFVTAIHTAEKGIHGQFVAIDAASLAQTRLGPPGWEAMDNIWLPDGTGFVTSAYRFLVSYPDGRHRRITSDSNGYFSFDLAADGATIAAIRSAKVANIWSIPVEGKARPRQLTFNATSDSAVRRFVLLDGAIAFSAATDHYSHLFTVGADGQSPRQITSGPSYEEVHRALPSGEPRYGGVVPGSQPRREDDAVQPRRFPARSLVGPRPLGRAAEDRHQLRLPRGHLTRQPHGRVSRRPGGGRDLSDDVHRDPDRGRSTDRDVHVAAAVPAAEVDAGRKGTLLPGVEGQRLQPLCPAALRRPAATRHATAQGRRRRLSLVARREAALPAAHDRRRVEPLEHRNGRARVAAGYGLPDGVDLRPRRRRGREDALLPVRQHEQ